jgi:hypothetical protein
MRERQDTARVLIVAAILFASMFAAALLAGQLALIAGFAAAFAAATYLLDRDLRDDVNAWFRKAPAASPVASPGAPSSPHTSARGWGGTRGQAGD